MGLPQCRPGCLSPKSAEDISSLAGGAGNGRRKKVILGFAKSQSILECFPPLWLLFFGFAESSHQIN